MLQKQFKNQTQEDLHVPRSAPHFVQECLTSLHEFKHKQQNPVHKKGINKVHHILEAIPC